MAAKPKWKWNKSKFEATKGRKKKKTGENKDNRSGHRETGTQGLKRKGTRTRTGGT